MRPFEETANPTPCPLRDDTEGIRGGRAWELGDRG